jgi:cephalosporin-C deacetylase-like acetyl esterase
MHASRLLAGLALCSTILSFAFADEPIAQASTPPGEPKQGPLDEILHRYLLDQAHQQFDTRRKAIAAIKTRDDIVRRQKELRGFFLNSLADLPAKTSLNPRIVGTSKRDGYRVEKVIFESRPDHHVTASLYIPDGTGPFPGVLLPCGHSDNGKAYEGYQRACILLAKNGMAVFCYDPIGQGERFQMLDAKGKPVVRGTTEHTMAGIGALLVGRQLASYMIWDGLRSLDYLASRPEVDPARLGCTGNSGGGTLTAYLMALDDRIAVAAPSCYITSLERLFATIGPQDAEQNVTGQVAAGMEHADFITLRAPKPTLITAGTRDFFDIGGSWDTFREVKLIYGRLGYGERVDLFESDEEHGFTRPRRIATARWLSRWLLKKDDATDEPDFPVATDIELQCTRTGQVLSDFKDVSVFDLNTRRERELQPAREAARMRSSTEAFRSDVKNRLGLARAQVKQAIVRTVKDGPERSLEFELEPGIVLPALELRQRDGSSAGLTVVKVGADWDKERSSSHVEARDVASRSRVVLVDPRGMGKTSPQAESGRNASPFGRDWRDAYIALAIGRPLLAQRAADLLNMLDGLAAEPREHEHKGFHLVGIGAAGPVVLHAALLDEHGLIKQVTLERSLISWADVVGRGISRDQMGNVVPGVLQSYDLPDLAARLAPLRLTVRAPVDAIGNPVSQATLEEAYAHVIKSYGANSALELLGRP